MTSQVIPEIQPFARPNPPPTEVSQLNQGLWQAWTEKNERLDKMRFARRVKLIAILVVLGVVSLGVVALARFVG
jgi:hypothetical protein